MTSRFLPSIRLSGGLPRRRRAVVVATFAIVLLWIAVMSRFGEGDVYPPLGGFALGVIAFVVWAARRVVLAGLRLRAGDLVLGASVGVATTLLTYPVFDLAVACLPQLQPMVLELYREAAVGSLASRLGWVFVIIVAEELLFRGLLPALLRSRLSDGWRIVAAIGLYAASTLGSASIIVFAMALVMGTIWMVLRHLTDSLVPGLVAHLIWTPSVILIWPVLARLGPA